MISLFLKSSSFRLLGLPFNSSLSCCQYIEDIAKAASKKIESLYRAKRFLTAESILYLYKSTIRPCLEYCCHIWAGAPITSLNLLDRVQRRLQNLVGEDPSCNRFLIVVMLLLCLSFIVIFMDIVQRK